MAKRILVCADVPNWAWHRRALSIQKYASPELYQVDVCLERSMGSIQLSRYDAILLMCWYSNKPKHANVIGMVSNSGLMYDYKEGLPPKDCPDFRMYAASKYKNKQRAKELLPKLDGVITIDERTLDFIAGLNQNVTLLDTGVDTEFFKPLHRDPRMRPVVGWAGKPSTETKFSTKGYEEVWLPLAKRLCAQCDLFQITNDASTAIRQEGMRAFYNYIDVFVCTSCAESTPSTVLEAIACGCPVISTGVGIVHRAVFHGVNGIVHSAWYDAVTANGTVGGLACSIADWTASPPVNARKASREVAVSNWGWADKADKWCAAMVG